MKEIASIVHLIEANPSGLLEMKPAMTIPEYRDAYGFGLKNIWTIYKSEKINWEDKVWKPWFAFPQNKTLAELVTVRAESTGDLLVVFIVETIKNGKVFCHLILSDEAYQQILSDNTQHVLQVHQMYTKFFKDHIALNMSVAN